VADPGAVPGKVPRSGGFELDPPMTQPLA
jgi:hypothetical protein